MRSENKLFLIAYFLDKTCSKNYHNRTVHVKIIPSQRWYVLLRHFVVVVHGVMKSAPFKAEAMTLKAHFTVGRVA